ncbi:putative peptidase family-domain-containing protein [Phaeosphaeriaceae sp. PMI808]|nr:putative peptidase family-domain-containing protein [Phaeosphaeriaceae sp. PMI808]
MVAYTSLVLLGASAAFANPLFPRQQNAPASTVTVTAQAPVNTAWDAGAVTEYPIHASCNASQRAYIKTGLQETMLISKQARDHILRWGNSSAIYQKYFGNAPTGEPLGWFSKIVDGDKAGILFRCDNVDGNCRQSGWAGHWRGANASSETVICDLSYELRRPLQGMCGFGYNVANGATNFYWASDLLHRLLHIPKVGEGVVEHYGAEGKYPGVISLAKTNATYAVRNSDTLQYFALEVYAHDIAVPGVGCPGTYTATSTPVAAATSSRAGSGTAAPVQASAKPSRAATSRAAETCTPHDDHWHCPPGVPQPTSPPS